MSKIYVVSAMCGEYSDRSEWIVAAYTREDDAKKHVEKAEAYAKLWPAPGYQEMKSPCDERFSNCYRTSYWYSETELKTAFIEPEPIQ